ncbi:MAG: esterase-like activity of phytase family protein [Devosia sp.]
MKRLSGAMVIALLAGLSPLQAAEVTVTSTQITNFGDTGLDGRLGQLMFRGGIAMVAQDDTFGGLSGLAPTGPNQQVTFVSDRGNFVSGQLAYDDDNRLFGLIGVQIEPMQNSKGTPLPRQYAKDAEGIDTLYRGDAPVGVRVSFEHLTRVADFALSDGVPGGAAREVIIPEWLSNLRTNQSLESVCVAPPRSPIAGSTLLLTEDRDDGAGNHSGWLIGGKDKGAISYAATPGIYPSDCVFLPDGDLLVLERGLNLLTFSMALRRIPAAEVRAGNLMVGELLLAANGSAIDNMESLAVHQAPGGETRILIGSDNNFNDWERSLLLEFSLVN